MKFLFFILLVGLVFLDKFICIKQDNKSSLNNEKEQVDMSMIKKAQSIVNQPEFLKKKETEHVKNILTAIQKTPNVKISNINTEINIKKDKTEGEVYEKVKYILKDGMFDSIVRKISLGGTSDRHFSFKLASA